MSAHILLNFNEFGKRNTMACLPNIVWLFRKKTIIFNNKRARLFDTLYYLSYDT